MDAERLRFGGERSGCFVSRNPIAEAVLASKAKLRRSRFYRHK
jgi:hypothetical protein